MEKKKLTKLSLNKESIARLNSQEMSELKGEGWYDWVMGGMSLGAGFIPIGGLLGGALCYVLGAGGGFSQYADCASSVCGS